MNGAPAPDPIERLTAAEEIRQLAYGYAYAVDTRDRELLEAQWAEPAGPVDYPDINLLTVRADCERWFGKGPTVHFVGNHRIDVVDRDHATGVVYCWAQLDFVDRFVDQSILYQDQYVRTEDGWRFDVRRHLLFFGQPRAENPIDQEPDGWPKVHYGRGSLPRDLMPAERADRFLARG